MNSTAPVFFSGEYIGFNPPDSTRVYLQVCGRCRTQNHSRAVTSGMCAWCRWDGNAIEHSVGMDSEILDTFPSACSGEDQ